MKAPSLNKSEDSGAGIAFALGAYVFWGFLPIYLKALAHVSPAEVIAHRVIWSLPIALVVLIWMGRTADLRAALHSPRMLVMGAATATMVSINWGIYIWAIGAGHTIDAALGYYINPLFSVLLGRVVLGEQISRVQAGAIALAFAAVLILIFTSGTVPWVALGLTISWGAYAFLKKSLPIGPNQGFALEVLLLTPLAMGYVIWVWLSGDGHFLTGSLSDTALLIGCGVVTAVPLMFYANGAKRLQLTTIAMLQYLTPTMVFLVAVFVFDEPFGTARAIAFPMIWLALLIFTATLVTGRKRSPLVVPSG